MMVVDARGRTRRGRFAPVVVATAAATMLAGGVIALAAPTPPPPAHNAGQDGLAAVGPIDDSPSGGGLPIYYRDTNGLRLEICLDPADAMCIPSPLPNPAGPRVFPTNFPDEAFWWAADATMQTAGGGDADLVLANEAAFINELPAQGDQVAFGRIRVRIDNLPVGTYVITPYAALAL